jgi:O-antigen ligase
MIKHAKFGADFNFTYGQFKGLLLLLFPLLVILGNAEIWLGGSSITLPVLLVLLLPVTLVEIFRARRGFLNREWIPFFFLYVLLFSCGVLSALFDDVTRAQRNAAALLPLVMAITVLFCFRDISLDFNVVRVMCVAGGSLATLVLIKSVVLFIPALQGGDLAEVYRLKSEMGLPLGKSNFLAVLLVFFSVFAWRVSKLLWLFILFATCLTLSKFGIFFVLIAGCCTYMLSLFRLSVVLAVLGGGAAFLVLPALLFPSEIITLANNYSLPASLVARFELWSAALDLLKLNFFWGGSPGGFTTYLELVGWPRHEWGTHNFILAQWIEYGFLGVCVYLAMIVRFFLVRSCNACADDELIKLSGAILLFYALFENVVGLVAFEMMFAYLLCLLSARRAS